MNLDPFLKKGLDPKDPFNSRYILNQINFENLSDEYVNEIMILSDIFMKVNINDFKDILIKNYMIKFKISYTSLMIFCNYIELNEDLLHLKSTFESNLIQYKNESKPEEIKIKNLLNEIINAEQQLLNPDKSNSKEICFKSNNNVLLKIIPKGFIGLQFKKTEPEQELSNIEKYEIKYKTLFFELFCKNISQYFEYSKEVFSMYEISLFINFYLKK
jgi:hypothetical protein